MIVSRLKAHAKVPENISRTSAVPSHENGTGDVAGIDSLIYGIDHGDEVAVDLADGKVRMHTYIEGEEGAAFIAVGYLATGSLSAWWAANCNPSITPSARASDQLAALSA